MVELKNLLVSEVIIKDADTSNVTLVNVLDDLAAESFPIVLQKLASLATFKKSEDDLDRHDFMIVVKNNATVMIDQKFKIDFSGKLGCKAILQIGGLPVNAPGLLTFHIYSEELQISQTYEINISQRQMLKVQQ